MQDFLDKFTNHLKHVLTRALTLVTEYEIPVVEPKHLFWALATQKGSVGADLIENASMSISSIRSFALDSAEEKKSPNTDSLPILSEKTREAMEQAVVFADRYYHQYIGTEHLLAGLLHVHDANLLRFFDVEHVDEAKLTSRTLETLKNTGRYQSFSTFSFDSTFAKQPASPLSYSEPINELDFQNQESLLTQFAVDLTSPEVQKELHPVIGRKHEVERLMQILCRKTKNNPMLIGDPGVGKTAIVEGFARKILDGSVPGKLTHMRVLSLDLSLLIAGTVYRGEFEGRLKQIIEEVSQDSSIILFIDEIHTIVGAGASSGTLDAANILKPALARGAIRCIGATTADEYKKYIESDPALERRFCPVWVNEPSAEETLNVLKGIRPFYESYHGIEISDSALETAVHFATEHIPNKRNPDKSIDLVDETAARLVLKTTLTEIDPSYGALKQELRAIHKEKHRAVNEERFYDAVSLKSREEQLLEELDKSQPTPRTKEGKITDKDVLEVVSSMHTTFSQTGKASHLQQLEQLLKGEVFGQKESVEHISHTLRLASYTNKKKNGPLASFLFVGPKSVGKNHTANVIAQTLFKNPDTLIRLDMSTFAERHSISKIIGSPAGYVGYRETSLLDRLKHQPSAVVVFDGIDRAHPTVLGLLHQMLENGSLEDATGKTISLRRSVIVLISHLDEKDLSSNLGFTESVQTDLFHQRSAQLVKDRFPESFIESLNSVCYFNILDEDARISITTRALETIREAMERERVKLTWDESIYTHLQAQFDMMKGARDVLARIESEIESKLMDQFLNKKTRPKRLHISADNKRISVKRQ